MPSQSSKSVVVMIEAISNPSQLPVHSHHPSNLNLLQGWRILDRRYQCLRLVLQSVLRDQCQRWARGDHLMLEWICWMGVQDLRRLRCSSQWIMDIMQIIIIFQAQGVRIESISELVKELILRLKLVHSVLMDGHWIGHSHWQLEWVRRRTRWELLPPRSPSDSKTQLRRCKK